MSKPLILELKERFDYSEEEQEVGKWIDGKTIYQKTFKINIPSQETVNFKHNIQNIGVAWINPASFLDFNNVFLPLNYFRYGTDNNLYAHVSIENISIKVQAVGWIGNDAYITINYTKKN